jgi:hypothetical protein
MGQLHEYDGMYDDMENMPTRFGVTPSLMKHSDEPIRGQCFIATVKISGYEIVNTTQIFTEDSIKKHLMEKLVGELFDNKYIEFTKEKNNLTNEYIFRARIFAVPDDRVRVLRDNGVIE